MWTARQRGVVGGIIVLLVVGLGVRAWRNPVFVSDPMPERGWRAGQLADRVNVNSADADELLAVPGLGEKRAKAIVAYRGQFVREGRGSVAFEKPEDLLKVDGVGWATMKNVSAYLVFGGAATIPSGAESSR